MCRKRFICDDEKCHRRVCRAPWIIHNRYLTFTDHRQECLAQRTQRKIIIIHERTNERRKEGRNECVCIVLQYSEVRIWLCIRQAQYIVHWVEKPLLALALTNTENIPKHCYTMLQPILFDARLSFGACEKYNESPDRS